MKKHSMFVKYHYLNTIVMIECNQVFVLIETRTFRKTENPHKEVTDVWKMLEKPHNAP